MFEFLYKWIQNLSFYLVIITAVLQILPGKEYKKYIQFFSGMVMILLILTPILKLTGTQGQFYELYHSKQYEMEKREIEKRQAYLKDLDILDFVPDEYHTEIPKKEEKINDMIEVREVQIGE